ncbi:MAG: LptF/LptG family permease [Calditrichaeota bacterium]|nr:LptF/LptG family permease [Candidatus Cloacimonadota bacterium]MCB1046128.1 LptF/LptG family permease [Calditrichota bacterium]MCB9472881.1 LptF/LptG family permease [Candidatus Delongbacteria bacterium]
MSRLTRYILREHIAPFIYSLLLIVFLFVLNFAFQVLGKILGKGLPGGLILEFFLYNIAWILALAVPMAALIASLMAFGRLASDHEITALKSTGVSVFRLIYPVLVAGTLICVAMISYNNWVLPDFNYKSSLLRKTIYRKQPTMQLEEGMFLQDVPGYVLNARRVDSNTQRMYSVTIFDESDRKLHTTIVADSADLAFEESLASFELHLFDGQIHQRRWAKDNDYTRLDFRESLMQIAARNMVINRQTSKYRGDRELSIGQMLERIRRWEETPDRNLERIRSAWVEIHKKFSIPVAIILFVLIGGPLGIKSGSGSLVVSGMLSVIFFLGYWIFLIGGEDLADAGYVSPLVAMWTPNVLLLILGIWLMRSAMRDGTPIQLPGWVDRLFKRNLNDSEQDRLENEAMAELARELEQESETKS